MLAKRRIRVLVVSSKTFYFVERGRQRGATYDVLRAFEDDLNRRLKTGNLKVNVVFIPVQAGRPAPRAGGGPGRHRGGEPDGQPEREQVRIDFSSPLCTGGTRSS